MLALAHARIRVNPHAPMHVLAVVKLTHSALLRATAICVHLRVS